MEKITLDCLVKNIDLPIGECLKDGRTWKITEKDFSKLDIISQLNLVFGMHDKVLILTDGTNPVGAVIFYGDRDIQLQILPEYQGKGYASAIAHNGILKSECYPNQKATIARCEIHCRSDYELRHHILDLIGVPVRNEKKLLRFIAKEEARTMRNAEEECARFDYLDEHNLLTGTPADDYYIEYGCWPSEAAGEYFKTYHEYPDDYELAWFNEHCEWPDNEGAVYENLIA